MNWKVFLPFFLLFIDLSVFGQTADTVKILDLKMVPVTGQRDNVTRLPKTQDTYI